MHLVAIHSRERDLDVSPTGRTHDSDVDLEGVLVRVIASSAIAPRDLGAPIPAATSPSLSYTAAASTSRARACAGW